MAWMTAADAWLNAAFDGLARSPRRAAAALVLLCLACHAPGLASFPVTDRDEARFSQASKQMLETGEFIDIRFQETPRYKKPVGIYWLQAAATAAFGEPPRNAIWTYRLPSLLAGLAATLALWWAAGPLWGRRVALGAAALFGTGFTLAFEARIAKADAAQTVAIVVMFGALARLYLWRRPRAALVGTAMAFWVALALAILIKGPVAPIILALTLGTLVALDKDRRWLGNLHAAWGIPVVLAIILPWFIAITLRSGPEFWRLSMGQDFAAKIASGQENHGGPPGTYIVLFWLTFWPATLVAAGAAFAWLWRQRRVSRRALVLLAWVLPFWVLLELTPTKLPHYALPLYPALAIGLAWALEARLLRGGPLPVTYRHAAALWLLVALLLLAALGGALWAFERTPTAAEIALGAAALVAAGVAFAAAWRARMALAMVAAGGAAACAYTLGFALVAPRLDAVWPARAALAASQALSRCVAGPSAFTGFNEPSTVFYHGTRTVLTSGAGVADALIDGRAALGFVTEGKRAEAEAQSASRGAPLVRAGCLPILDVNGSASTLSILAPAGAGLAPCPLPAAMQCTGRVPRWQRLAE